ncbi:MAG: penicillin-binding protein activator [Paracoccaceae bacterium]
MFNFSIFSGLRKGIASIFAPLAILGLAACDPGALGSLTTSGPKLDTSKPVPVALLVPRGSGSSSDDLIAQNLENAARMAMSDLNGVDIDLRVYATSANPQIAASQAAKAVNEGAQVIIGPLYAEAANAAGVAVANTGVNVLSFSNNTTIAGGNVFVLGSTFQNTADRLVGYANRSGANRVVVVHAQDVAGQLGRNAIQNALARQGGSLAGSVDYPLSQQGVVDSVQRIKTTVDNSGANAVFLTSSTASALPLLAQLLPEAGVNPASTQFIGLTRWDIPPQTLQLPGLQNGWFALPDPNRSAAFRNRYSATYGGAPHPLAGLAFDGIAAVGALAARGSGNALSGAALTQGAGFQGANGIFRLRPDGSNQRGLAVATIKDQRVVIVDPAPSSFGGAGF